VSQIGTREIEPVDTHRRAVTEVRRLRSGRGKARLEAEKVARGALPPCCRIDAPDAANEAVRVPGSSDHRFR
jgi:hypothetical protein